MSLGVGLMAERATEPTQAIAMLSEALAGDVAGSTGHRRFGFFCVHHGLIIQRALAVCQEQNAGMGS